MRSIPQRFQYADSILTRLEESGRENLSRCKGNGCPQGGDVPEMVLLSGFSEFFLWKRGGSNKMTERLPKIRFSQFLNRGNTDSDALMLQNVKEWMDGAE